MFSKRLEGLVVAAAMLFSLAVGAPATAGYKECEGFPNGGMVYHIVSGHKGVVNSHWRMNEAKPTARNCGYDVRFFDPQGQPYTLEKIRRYELTLTVPPRPAVVAVQLQQPVPVALPASPRPTPNFGLPKK